jgi:hypothetical protein
LSRQFTYGAQLQASYLNKLASWFDASLFTPWEAYGGPIRILV